MNQMEAEEVPFSVSLPLLGVGAFTLLLSVCFCCYLCRLKKNAIREEQGYIMRKFTSSDRNQQNDTCPVCLEEFKPGEKLAVCACKHGFHSNCLLQWLQQRNTCPMCKAPVRDTARETTGNSVTSRGKVSASGAGGRVVGWNHGETGIFSRGSSDKNSPDL